MSVNVSAKAAGQVGLGSRVDLSQLGGATSPAGMSAGLFVLLLLVVVAIALSVR